MEIPNQNSLTSLNNHNHEGSNDEEAKIGKGYSHNHIFHTNGFHSHIESDSREELKVSIPSRSQHNNGKSSKLKKFDISALKRDPEMYKQLLEEAIRIEKNNNKSTIYELNFQICCPTKFGEKILIVGSQEFLGNWDASCGLELEWTSENIWRVSIPITEEQISYFEYKYVRIKGSDVAWEGGNNRVWRISDGKPKGSSLIFNQQDKWQNN